MERIGLVVQFHLLMTGVLAGLTLLLSLRFPYPETRLAFYLTLLLQAASAVAVLALVMTNDFSLLWIPWVTFIAATLSFLLFSVRVIRSHYQRLRR